MNNDRFHKRVALWAFSKSGRSRKSWMYSVSDFLNGNNLTQYTNIAEKFQHLLALYVMLKISYSKNSRQAGTAELIATKVPLAKVVISYDCTSF